MLCIISCWCARYSNSSIGHGPITFGSDHHSDQNQIHEEHSILAYWTTELLIYLRTIPSAIRPAKPGGVTIYQNEKIRKRWCRQRFHSVMAGW